MSDSRNPCAKIFGVIMEAGGPAQKKYEKNKKNGVDGNRTRAPKNGTRYTNICFTINNWTEEEYDLLQETFAEKNMKYMVIGKEIGPQEGTPHLQCMAQLGRQWARATISKWPGFTRAAIYPCGNPEKQQKYCKEDLDWIELGKFQKSGKRNDLLAATELIKQGKTLKDLADDPATALCVVKFYKGLHYFRSLVRPSRTGPPKVFWLYGDAGVGKTWLATGVAEVLYSGDYWISDGSLSWFDEYDGQRVAILDEFDPSQCTLQRLHRLLDRYSMRVPFKGGFMDWSPDVIFITADSSPTEMYENRVTPRKLQQLLRRLFEIVECPELPELESDWPAHMLRRVEYVRRRIAGESTVSEHEPGTDAEGGDESLVRDGPLEIRQSISFSQYDSDLEEEPDFPPTIPYDSDEESSGPWLPAREKYNYDVLNNSNNNTTTTTTTTTALKEVIVLSSGSSSSSSDETCMDPVGVYSRESEAEEDPDLDFRKDPFEESDDDFEIPPPKKKFFLTDSLKERARRYEEEEGEVLKAAQGKQNEKPPRRAALVESRDKRPFKYVKGKKIYMKPKK